MNNLYILGLFLLVMSGLYLSASKTTAIQSPIKTVQDSEACPELTYDNYTFSDTPVLGSTLLKSLSNFIRVFKKSLI